MFIKRKNGKFLTLLVYVDDVLFVGDDLDMIKPNKEYLNNTFKIKDLGVAKYFLGLEMARSSTGISLSQQKCIIHLIKESRFLYLKPVPTLIVLTIRLTSEGEPLSDVTAYRGLIGTLISLLFIS